MAAMMAAIIVYLAFFGAAHASSRDLHQAETEFPPRCRCVRSRDNSPYGLSLDAPVLEGGNNKYCFKVVSNIKCLTSAACCNKDLGVEKIEFKAAPTCKSSVKKVTINGVNDPGFEYNTVDGLLRVTGINAPGGTNITICVFISLSSDCPTLSSVCDLPNGGCKYSIFNNERKCCPVDIVGGNAAPPPLLPNSQRPPYLPPPAQPPLAPSAPYTEEFPYCKCNRDVGASSLVVSALRPTPYGPYVTQVCFVISSSGPCSTPDSPCCDFLPYKVEFKANGACVKALLYSTINDGAPRPRLFQTKPHPLIKVTPLRLAGPTDTAKVCLFVRTSVCELDTLFPEGVTKVAVFNNPGEALKCCPVTRVQL